MKVEEQQQLGGPQLLPVWNDCVQLLQIPAAAAGAPLCCPSAAAFDPLGGLLCVGTREGTVSTFAAELGCICSSFAAAINSNSSSSSNGDTHEADLAVRSLIPLHAGILCKP